MKSRSSYGLVSFQPIVLFVFAKVHGCMSAQSTQMKVNLLQYMIKSMKAIKSSNLVTILECAVGVENILLKVQEI